MKSDIIFLGVIVMEITPKYQAVSDIRNWIA